MSSTKNVLVYSGTGAQGHQIVRLLLEEGATARVIVRNPTRASGLAQLGAEIVQGNLADIESLKRASQGVDAVVLVLPVGFDRAEGRSFGTNAVAAARATGVSRFIYNSSGPIIEVDTGSATADLKRDVAECVEQSGIPYGILEPTIYLENFVAPWALPKLISEGTISYPLPAEFPVSWISLQDNAKCTVAAVLHDKLESGRMMIGGANCIDGSELATVMSKTLGRTISYVQMPLEQFATGVDRMLGSRAGSELVAWYRWVARFGAKIYRRDRATIESTLAVQLSTVVEWMMGQKLTVSPV